MEYDYFDFYDQKKVERLNQKRSKQWLKLYKKIMDARNAGDEQALTEAKQEMREHEALDEILRSKAYNAGCCWV